MLDGPGLEFCMLRSSEPGVRWGVPFDECHVAGVMVLAILGRMPKLRTVLPFAWNASASNPILKRLTLAL